MAFAYDLTFGILSLSSYADIKSMNIISSDVDVNTYKLFRILGIKSKQMIKALRMLETPFFRIFKEIKRRCQITIWWYWKWIAKIHKAKITYMIIQNYKNSLKPLKKLKELVFFREQEIRNIKERKLNVLNQFKMWRRRYIA